MVLVCWNSCWNEVGLENCQYPGHLLHPMFRRNHFWSLVRTEACEKGGLRSGRDWHKSGSTSKRYASNLEAKSVDRDSNKVTAAAK
jgi:hypothetical protein